MLKGDCDERVSQVVQSDRLEPLTVQPGLVARPVQSAERVSPRLRLPAPGREHERVRTHEGDFPLRLAGAMLDAHEAGASKAELGRALGVSRQRVDELLARAPSRACSRRRGRDRLVHLAVRARRPQESVLCSGRTPPGI